MQARSLDAWHSKLSRLSLACVLFSLEIVAYASPRKRALREVSGITRLGSYLLVVDDHEPGSYFRFPLGPARGPLIRIDPEGAERVRFPWAGLSIDLESIGVLADGRVVVLSERLRALVGKAGVVAQYGPAFAEFGGRGLEGLAVRRLPGRSSRLAVLWEGGYPEVPRLLPQLQALAGGHPLRPVVLLHDLKAGAVGVTIQPTDALRLTELDVPLPDGSEPRAQRFRAPDLVWAEWHRGETEETGFIVLISSQNSGQEPEYQHHWLQRFSLDGKRVGEPLDLDALAPEGFKGVNWEGLAWFEEGRALVVIHELGKKTALGALIVELPKEWGIVKPNTARFSHTLVREAEYYLSGPQQARPADGRFPLGTRVAALRRRGSYWYVRSETDIRAYVAADALKPAAE